MKLNLPRVCGDDSKGKQTYERRRIITKNLAPHA